MRRNGLYVAGRDLRKVDLTTGKVTRINSVPGPIRDMSYDKKRDVLWALSEQGNEIFNLDPATGAILRLDVVSDLKEFTPLLLSDIMVTYGPVQIGGKTYICPVRSVSIMRFRSVNNSTAWNESFRTYGPWVTMVDEYTFDDFHMFRSESRVLAPPPSPPEKN